MPQLEDMYYFQEGLMSPEKKVRYLSELDTVESLGRKMFILAESWKFMRGPCDRWINYRFYEIYEKVGNMNKERKRRLGIK